MLQCDRPSPTFDSVSPLDWRNLFAERLRGQPVPLFHFGDLVLPAASLWTAKRYWVKSFRAMGLEAGDRIAFAAKPGPGLLGAMLAAIWERLTLVMLPPKLDVASVMNEIDCRACIVDEENPTDDDIVHWRLTRQPIVEEATGELRNTLAPRSPETRFLLQTSGSTGSPRWVALSDVNVLSVIQSHRAALGLSGLRVGSILPWHHAFGLIIGLFPALLDAELIYRDPSGGRDMDSVIDAIRMFDLQHVDMVPRQARALAQAPDAEELLALGLGGVIGGAPIDALLSQSLSNRGFRVGYGQTEASPGLTLGAPGQLSPGYIGQAVGCDLRRSTEGELEFRGRNACAGVWDTSTLQVRAIETEWRGTGDLVEPTGEGWQFIGRKDDRFKLDNGRIVCPHRMERAIEQCSKHIAQACLVTQDSGKSLTLYLFQEAMQRQADIKDVRSAMGELSSRLSDVFIGDLATCPRTMKGDIDRRQLAKHSVGIDFPGLAKIQYS